MIRKTCEPQFLAGDLWKPDEYPQEIRNDQSTVSKKIASNVLWRIGNQEQTGTVADRFAASVVPNRRHLATLVEAKVSNRGTKANLCRCIISGKKENFERLTEIFEINFRKLFYSDFEPEFPEILVEWSAAIIHACGSYPVTVYINFCGLVKSVLRMPK